MVSFPWAYPVYIIDYPFICDLSIYIWSVLLFDSEMWLSISSLFSVFDSESNEIKNFT